VLSLPGVGTHLATDGSFELQGVPGSYPEVYLAIPELPEGQTFRRIAVRPGDDDIRIELQPEQVVHGRVLNAYNERPLAGAAVSHEHGPRGEEVVLCDADGRFTIRRVPAGPVRFLASATLPRGAVPPAARPNSRAQTVLLQGSVQAIVVPGETAADELVIRVE